MLTKKILLLVVACQFYITSPLMAQGVAMDQVRVTVFDDQLVSRQPDRYIGWPSVVATSEGELLAVFSGDRDWHLCPWGKIYLTRSSDGGETWSNPVIAVDTPLDDRDAGILIAHDGSVLITFNASLVFDKPAKYPQYQEYAKSLNPDTRQQWEHQWVYRSIDGGKTFSAQGTVPTGTPHGPTLLSDGRLLMVRPDVYESHDLGQSWNKIAEIEQPADWKSNNAFLSEMHAVEADDGRIVALARYRDKANNDHALRQMDSFDGGHTWTPLRSTGMVGYPPHVLKLSNGWLVATYARRIAPLGQRATISKNNGQTWLHEQEVLLSDAIAQSPIDLGYPATAEFSDGELFTVYYQVADESHKEMPSLMGTRWRLDR